MPIQRTPIEPKRRNSSTPKTAAKVAKAFVKATAAYHRNFRDMFDGLENLSDDRFWELTEVLIYCINANKYRPNPVELGVSEFFRKPRADHFHEVEQKQLIIFPRYTFGEALRYARNYAEMVGRILNYLTLTRTTIDLGKRGDSLYDLIDSLPLAGHLVISKLFGDGYENGKQFLNEVALSDLGTFFEGENYVDTTLFSQARRYYVYEVAFDEIDKLDVTI